MLAHDFCRCLGEGCERKDDCERHIALRYKTGPCIISQAKHLCHWVDDKKFSDYFIQHKDEKGGE